MAAKNKPLDKFTLAAAVLILLAILYFAYSFLMGIKAPVTSFNYSLGQFKTVDSGTLGAAKELIACGDWPIVAVNLSAGRGNPFNRQLSALPQMAATSSIFCSPVTQ